VCSALGGALASIVAASRILFCALPGYRPVEPGGADFRSERHAPQRRPLCHPRSDAGIRGNTRRLSCVGIGRILWASRSEALALLIVYLLVVVSAAGALIRPSGRGTRWLLIIPAVAALAIAYTVWSSVYPPQPGAYRVIPWIVLAWCCAPVIATLVSSQACRAHCVRRPGRKLPNGARLTSETYITHCGLIPADLITFVHFRGVVSDELGELAGELGGATMRRGRPTAA